MGMAPHKTKALIADLCTFRGKIILSPALQVASIIDCTEEVVPPIIKKAWAAPNASAASSSASLIIEMGCPRLSRDFIEFTSIPTHFSPNNSTSSGFPRPRLWPGTSKGTILFFRNFTKPS